MPIAPPVPGLYTFQRVGAASDAERRLAVHLRDELTADGWDVTVESFWCHPSWPAAHGWHLLLAVAGSLLTATASPRAGGILVLLALLSFLADWATGASVGRWLTPLRASQNVVAEPAGAGEGGRLILTAALDFPREAIATAQRLRGLTARVSAAARGPVPGWAGWLVLLQLWLLVVVLLRVNGAAGTTVKIAQLLPTVLLVLAVAGLVDLAAAPPAVEAPAATAALAAALALARDLRAGAPADLTPRLVLQGGGEVQGAGLRHHLRHRRRRRRPGRGRRAANRPITAVLAFTGLPGPLPRRGPGWLARTGALLPLRPHPRLAAAATAAARAVPELEAQELHRAISGPALPAQVARIPALTLATSGPPRPPAGRPASSAAATSLAELGLLIAEELS